MCQRESRATGSCATEWHRLGQPNSHSCTVCHSLAVQVLTYRTVWGLSWVHTDMQLHSHAPHTPHVTLGTYICLKWRSVGFFFSCPWSSCHWLTWVMAPPPLTMPALALHPAALCYSRFGRRCPPPKLAAAIDPTWLCHSCRLIIRLITPPLWFFAPAYSLSILPSGITTRFPSEVESNFMKWGMSKDRRANLVWRAFCFLLTVISRKSRKGTEWRLVLSCCGGRILCQGHKVMRILGCSPGSQCLLIKQWDDRPFAAWITALSSYWKWLAFFWGGKRHM